MILLVLQNPPTPQAENIKPFFVEGWGGGVLIFSGTRIWENLSNSTVTVAQITDSCKSCNSDLVHFCVKIYRDLFWISPLIIV